MTDGLQAEFVLTAALGVWHAGGRSLAGHMSLDLISASVSGDDGRILMTLKSNQFCILPCSILGTQLHCRPGKWQMSDRTVRPGEWEGGGHTHILKKTGQTWASQHRRGGKAGEGRGGGGGRGEGREEGRRRLLVPEGPNTVRTCILFRGPDFCHTVLCELGWAMRDNFNPNPQSVTSQFKR